MIFDVTIVIILEFLAIKYFKIKKKKGTCTRMFIAALFIIVRIWKQPKCPSTDKWIKRDGMYTQWNTTQP